MAELLKKTIHAITKYRMAGAGDKVLAAVSGGPDSMAMLYALHELKAGLGITLAVAHMDHGLRDDSHLDARFVEAAAANLGIDCITKRVELKTCTGPGVNTQDAARKARYDFLEKAADSTGSCRIAVAHTMDDQAETYLMRVLRGSGPHGLSSIPPVRGRVIRPLITATREDVTAYLALRGIGHRTDPTNLKTDYLRNRLRIELLPQLMRYNPNITETLARSADIMRDEDAFLEAAAEASLDALIIEDRGWFVSVALAVFNSLHPGLKRRATRRISGRLKGDLLGLGTGHVEDALALIERGGTGRGVDLPDGVRVELSYGSVLFYLPEHMPNGFDIPLLVPGRAVISEAGLTIEAERLDAAEPPSGASEAHCFFDAESLSGPLRLRSKRPGDLFHPSGMDGTKKLKELFIDMKMPRLLRETTPILICGDEIAWVVGVRADRRFLAREGVRGVVRVTARKISGQ